MTDLIKALTDAGASLATIAILAYLLIQQGRMMRGFQETITKNTEAVHRLGEVLEKKM